MKLADLKVGEEKTVYFIHYYDEKTRMWCPFINSKGYSHFSEEYLLYDENEVKELSDKYFIYKQTTKRVR